MCGFVRWPPLKVNECRVEAIGEPVGAGVPRMVLAVLVDGVERRFPLWNVAKQDTHAWVMQAGLSPKTLRELADSMEDGQYGDHWKVK